MDPKIEARLKALEADNKFLRQRLNEVRLHCQLSPILDAQILAINARSPLGGNAA